MSETKRILLVADYGKDDLAFKEATQRLYELAQDAGLKVTVDIVSVDPFSTAQTAAVVAQAAEDGRYDMIYHNTAPRKDMKKARHNNDGEGLIFARYKNDNHETLIVGVNSGNAETVNTSALLPAERLAGGVQEIDSATKGSQFRSRDVFPPHVIAALNGTITLKGPAEIPEALDAGLVARARKEAAALLAEAYAHQFVRHGDSQQRYVTIIGGRSEADRLVPDIAGHHPGAEVDMLPLKSTKNQWIEAGFASAQLALNSQAPSKRTIIALPGNATLEATGTLHEAALDNGAKIVTSDLRALIFARDRIVEAESSFKLADLDRVARLPAEITPAYTDGYGNIKLAIQHKPLLQKLGYNEPRNAIGAGERGVTSVRINGQEVEAFVGNPQANGSFAVHDGEYALSSGSSGWAAKAGDAERTYFAEVFLRGGNASSELHSPQPGDSISIQRKPNQRDLAPSTGVNGEGLEAEFAPAKAKGVL